MTATRAEPIGRAPGTPRGLAQFAASEGAGEPLAPAVRASLEGSFGVPLGEVRVHADARSAAVAAGLRARAFTYGTHVFLGPREQPTDLRLMAHEVAHVIQQRGAAPTPQKLSEARADAFEREAEGAAEAALRREPFEVRGRAGRQGVQRLGIGDALDYFADRANHIPGFRMFTVVIGVNPVNMSRVERSPANILRALVEFIPGGGLIVQALDNHGIFDRVGNWVEEQIRTLGMTGGLIRAALDEFLESLSWSDILDLGGVWNRAVRIFTEPINRIIRFAGGLVTGIVRFVREAILRPLAALAQGTRGYDLLKAVLGQDPVTGEPVARNPEALIGGFMRLIGQEEVWENLRRANAVPRAWAWFQGALGGLMGYVRQIPSLLVSALQRLELADVVLVPRAFSRIAGAFGGFVGSFLSWAGGQVLGLLQIIFEVVAPSVMPYIRRAAGAFRSIISDPVGFVRNLVRAGVQGFRQFAGNFLSHLRASLISWLTGTMRGVNVYVPRAFDLLEVIKFVLSVLGLTWQNIRQRLVRVMGETPVRVLETGFDIVVTLVRQGPAAAWERIRESISNLREMVMEQVMSFVSTRVVQAAITTLVTSLNPAGAFIQAIIATYNTVMFFVERMRQIGQVVAAYIDSIAAIASGNIGTAANRVETTMAGMLTLVISFLARIARLGNVGDAVVRIVNRVRAPIDRALDRVVDWIVTQARRLGRSVVRAVLGRVGVSVPIRARGESHRLYVDTRGSDARIMVASEPTPVERRLQTFSARINTEIHDASRRQLATSLIGRATPLAAQVDENADRLVRRYRSQSEAGAPPNNPQEDPENRVLTQREGALAELLSQLYELFGENPGDRNLQARAAYSGQAGAGDLSFTVETRSGTRYARVVASGPLASYIGQGGFNQAPRLIRAMNTLLRQSGENSAAVQRIAPEAVAPLRTAARAVITAATAAEQAGSQALTQSPVPAGAGSGEIRATADAAGTVANYRFMGAGGVLERATAALSERVRQNPALGRTAFHAMTEVNVELSHAFRRALERGAAETVGVAPPGEQGQAIPVVVGKQAGQTTSVPSAARSPQLEVTAVGRYERIRDTLNQLGHTHIRALLARLMGANVAVSPQKIGVRIRSDEPEARDPNVLVMQLSVLVVVEMVRAASAWSFLLGAVTAPVSAGNASALTQQFVSLLNPSAFPHTAEGFVEQYERRGAALYNTQARQIIARLTSEPQFQLGAGPFILRAQDIDAIANHLTERMYQRFLQLRQEVQQP